MTIKTLTTICLQKKKTVCDFARRIEVTKNNNRDKTFVENKDRKNGMILF